MYAWREERHACAGDKDGRWKAGQAMGTRALDARGRRGCMHAHREGRHACTRMTAEPIQLAPQSLLHLEVGEGGRARALDAGGVEAGDDVAEHEAAAGVALGAVHARARGRAVLARVQHQDALHAQLQLRAQPHRRRGIRECCMHVRPHPSELLAHACTPSCSCAARTREKYQCTGSLY
jgi:hypothetical protein